MKEQDLDETRYMDPKENQRFKKNMVRSVEDTQPLSSIESRDDIQQPFPKKKGDVRELSPIRKTGNLRKNTFHGIRFKRKKWIFLGISFLFAALIGFVIAGYRQDASDKQQDLHLRQEQIADQEKKLVAQERDLEKRRTEIESKKEALEKRQHELDSQAGRLQGRAEALQEDKPTSVIGKIVDKVSGKEGKREQAVAQTEARGAANADESANVHQSIADTQNMLDEIDKKMDQVQSMKRDVDQVKQQAQAAYEENRDTIDRVIGYARQGAALLASYLSR